VILVFDTPCLKAVTGESKAVAIAGSDQKSCRDKAEPWRNVEVSNEKVYEPTASLCMGSNHQ